MAAAAERVKIMGYPVIFQEFRQNESVRITYGLNPWAIRVSKTVPPPALSLSYSLKPAHLATA
jgi:hypothetical protein